MGGIPPQESSKDETVAGYPPESSKDEPEYPMDSNTTSTEETETETPTEENQADDEDIVFHPAESLDYFRNGIDKDFFEWVNPDEIEAGATYLRIFVS